MALFDLSHPLGAHTPVFPGDPPVEVRATKVLALGDAYAATELRLGSHAGTHVDAPAHLIPDGATLGAVPLDLWIGEGLLVDLEELPLIDLSAVPRLLVGNCTDGLPPGLARRIAGARVRLVGVDGPSVDPVESADLPSHRILLGAGLVLVENLRLDGVPRGEGRLFCLPLPVETGDGAPARVLWESGDRWRGR